MAGRLQDEVAIITGAGCVGPGWGNGRAASVIFAQEGAKVCAVDLNTKAVEETIEPIRATGSDIQTQICDVTYNTQVAAMVAARVAVFGRIDVLMNNVGGPAAGGPVVLSEDA